MLPLNPFQTNVLCPYPLKSLQNQKLYGVFRGVKRQKLPCNWLNIAIGSKFFVKISLKKAGNLSIYRKQDLCAKVYVKKKKKKKIEKMLQL